MAELLEEDPSVFLYGEDIAGKFGGAFKATKGLADKFPGRVMNAPIAEDAIMGVAIGAAIGGMKPIAEMQFADFGIWHLTRCAIMPRPITSAPVCR